MKRALMFWGGWEGHEPEKCVRLFVPFLKSHDYDIHVTNNLDALVDADIMRDLDLIVPCISCGEISDDQSKSLLERVKRGTGIAGWHGGLGDSFRTNTEYQYMVGGQFVAHPGGIVHYSVAITKPDDPIMEGIRDFAMHSEQYYMHVDPSNDVLATTTFSGEHDPWNKGTVMPVVWKRVYGEGRVFYSSLGHVAKDFETPEAMAIMQRGMLWASR
jgi:type 1 glutamine amidotransferase